MGENKSLCMSDILCAMSSCEMWGEVIIEGVCKNTGKGIVASVRRENLIDLVYVKVRVRENHDFEDLRCCVTYKIGEDIKEWLIENISEFKSVGVFLDFDIESKDFSWFMKDRLEESGGEEKDDSFDEVSKPKHYNSGGVETQYLIDEFVSKIDNPKIGWRIANTLKYLDRFTIKENPLRDLKKAREYLDMCIRILEESNG